MSRAFVKEDAADDAFDPLPELEVSDQPNFVTARGLHQIEQRIEWLEQGRIDAKATEDTEAIARAERDLRYWRQRLGSAQLVTPQSPPNKIRVGVTTWLELDDGSARKYTLVGEDEAQPRRGLISWLSPVAQSLLGREVGDEVIVQDHKAEIVKIAVEH